jgi:hypothetical protein
MVEGRRGVACGRGGGGGGCLRMGREDDAARDVRRGFERCSDDGDDRMGAEGGSREGGAGEGSIGILAPGAEG